MLKEVAVLTGHTDRVWCVAWNPTGTILASCGGDKVVRLWSQEPGSSKWTCMSTLEDAHTRTVRSITWSPCGTLLACASFDATTTVWKKEGEDFECVSTLEGHENEVKCVTFDSSGSFLATCGRDKSVWIWEAIDDGEFECAGVKQGHSQDVKCVLWHPTRPILASGSYDNSIKLWVEEDDDWTCEETLTGHNSTVWSITMDAGGHYMASCSDDKSIIVWRLAFPSDPLGGAPVPPGRPFSARRACTLSGFHDRTIYSVDFNAEGTLIASGSGDDSIRVFAKDAEVLDPDAPIFNLSDSVENAHGGDVNCVKWRPQSEAQIVAAGGVQLLASAGDDEVIKLWEWRP